MKAKSAKAKGSRLERRVAEEYRRIGIEAKRMPLSGAFSHLKADIFKPVKDGWHDECKNQEAVNLRAWWNQANSTCGMDTPVLHVSGNFRPILSIVSYKTFDSLLTELDQTGQRFMHNILEVTTQKINLWDKWSEVYESPAYGEPILKIEYLQLVVMSLEHYMEIRDCLNEESNKRRRKASKV